MSERAWERFWWMLAALTLLVIAMWVATTDKADANPVFEREIEMAGWCNNNDDMVKDVNGRCHHIDSYIDAYVDANPIPVHGADRCQEDEDWATVHWETPGATDTRNGTRMCVNHEELVMEGINELILDGTLIWEWDL